ncbi:hypothetical protein FKR81_31410 [Lentzea tibetensis]|uniref:Leucine rich repeat variant n=1 Tax=Lentzea tibetensis TaxID=2591470 RepID=A0A563ELH4_9PSEU|nr:hypothetical protein [Lentzea tibetensis]TWP47847.1 hypothetical protein FKR81_31410 [Lentzea tibetensis]
MGERSHAVLRGLAANTGLRFHVVRPLLDSPDRETAWNLARREDITAEAAETLSAHPDVMVRTKLAGNQAAAKYAWASLLADSPEEEVRRHLAIGNRYDYWPSRDHPLPEPAMWLLAHDEDEQVRASAARRLEVSERVATLLAQDPEPHVREMLAWGQHTEPVQRLLLADPEARVRQAALMLTPPPADLMEALLADQETRPHAARWATSAEELVEDEDAEVRKAVAGNPDLPLPLLEKLAEDEVESVRREIMLHPALPDEVRARVVASVRPNWYDNARWLYEATLEERLKHVDSDFVFFRRAIACSSDLPQDVIDRLAADEDFGVRLLLAQNNDTVPGAVVAALIPEVGRTKWELAKHPALTAEQLEAFAASEDPVLRAVAALSPNLAPATAVRLTANEDRQTRLAAAANPALPADHVIALLEAEEYGLVTAAASNPGIREKTAEELVATHSNHIA